MNWFFKYVFPVFFITIFVVVVSVFAFQAFLVVKVGTAIEEQGLKSVIERVWEGAPKQP